MSLATGVAALATRIATECNSIRTAIAGRQPLDTDLTDIAGLTHANDTILQTKSGAWSARTPAQVKTDLALVKGDVGLGSVDNTADTAKPVSTAQQAALDLKANLSQIAAPTTIKTGAYTAVPGELVMVNATAGPVTITLPSLTPGAIVAVKKIDSSANAVTITAAAGQNIGAQAAATTTILTQYQIAELRYNTATNWAIVGGQLALASLDARYRLHNQAPRAASIAANANVDCGLAGDVQLTVTGGTPVLTPTNGVNGRAVVIECLASGGARTVSLVGTVVLTTGVTSLSLSIPSGKVGVFIVRYSSLGTGVFELASAYLRA